MQFYEKTLKQYNQYTADPKKKNYFEIALTLGLMIVLLLMIYPAVTYILNLNKEIQAGRVVKEGLSQKIQDLQNARNAFADVQTDLPLLQLALPIGSDVDKYVQKPLEDLASRHGLTLKSIQFADLPISQPATENVKLRDMDFTLSLTGGYTNLNDFLKDLEKFVRVTNVDSITLKGSGSDVTVTISAVTNFLGSPVIIPNQTSGGTTP
ncbi:MAG TPA: type 4a pilus biogenesis protein PilO [Candidatus Saccharimonadales bacterium]|nr:type 4a pilus biogenesis protein PilO [Candidatus Saccharimonadales bacterium]